MDRSLSNRAADSLLYDRVQGDKCGSSGAWEKGVDQLEGLTDNFAVPGFVLFLRHQGGKVLDH